MVDMARTPEEIKQDAVLDCTPVDYPQPRYPYGLCIVLENDELEKLGLEANCEVGDYMHIICMAKVKSVSKNETTKGDICRVELQIEDMELENESHEFEEEVREPAYKSMYTAR
jgi:hypothetical protein